MRWSMGFLVLGLALGGCATESQPLWPGPDWKESGLPAAGPGLSSEAATAPNVEPPDQPVRTKKPTRRGSSTPPDLLFPPPATQTENPSTGVSAGALPPPAPDPGSQVLSPANPKAPYSANGFGYQREGTTLSGPNGTANIVGNSIIGPNGSACHAVGTSLFCN